MAAGDLGAGEINEILEVAQKLEDYSQIGALPPLLHGYSLALIFDETSFRTRAAFQRAMEDLGGQAHVYPAHEIRLGKYAKKTENFKDLANVISRFYSAVLCRIYENKIQTEFCELLSVPFLNGMCDLHHPTQALCDFLTIRRHFSGFEGVKIAFVGDATNVAFSLAQIATALHIPFSLACPNGVDFPAALSADLAVRKTTDPLVAVQDANVVITDTWVPMGKQNERTERVQMFLPYQVTPRLMQHARKDAIFLHNLPAIRGEEVTEDVLNGPQSVVYDEAVARLHVARALLLWALHPAWKDLSVSTERFMKVSELKR